MKTAELCNAGVCEMSTINIANVSLASVDWRFEEMPRNCREPNGEQSKEEESRHRRLGTNQRRNDPY